jgi:hypothetical protein
MSLSVVCHPLDLHPADALKLRHELASHRRLTDKEERAPAMGASWADAQIKTHVTRIYEGQCGCFTWLRSIRNMP